MLKYMIKMDGQWVRVLTENDIPEIIEKCKQMVLKELQGCTSESNGLESFIHHFED